MYLKGLYHQRRVELKAKTFTISLLAQTKSLILFNRGLVLGRLLAS